MVAREDWFAAESADFDAGGKDFSGEKVAFEDVAMWKKEGLVVIKRYELVSLTYMGWSLNPAIEVGIPSMITFDWSSASSTSSRCCKVH